MIYELRVSLRHTNEVVWRKIEIDSNMTFDKFSEILQSIFDWDGFRMHRFDISKSHGKRIKHVTIKPAILMRYTKLPDKKNKDDLDERKTKISDWLSNVKDRALYSYNIENEMVWEHEIVVEKIMHPEKGVLYPYCTGAKNLVPKESVTRELTEDQLTQTLAESKKLVQTINETLQDRLSHIISEVPDQGDHQWVQLLKRTKDYYRAAPWENLMKNDIFAVVDPLTKNWLFCSVLGFEREPYGLAVYIGKQGLAALMDHTQDGVLQRGVHANCLMLLFDDRQMLTQQDHALIKTNDIPFRGKKAWPQFRSYISDQMTAFRQDEEVRLMLVALEQAIQICEDPNLLSEIPNLFTKEKRILARIPVKSKSSNTDTFTNEILSTSTLMDSPGTDSDLKKAVSALDQTKMKALQQIRKKISATIEFALMPIPASDKSQQANRSMIAVGANQKDGHVYYQHQLFETDQMTKDKIKYYQEEFYLMLREINALPHWVATDAETAKMIEPLADKLGITIIVQERQPIAAILVQELFTEKNVR